VLSPSMAEDAARRRVVVLGSTGSIGTNCLDVIEHLPRRLQAVGLSAHENWEELFGQADRCQPRWVTVTGSKGRQLDAGRLPPRTQLLYGEDGIAQMVTDPEVDLVVTAIVGA